MIKHAELVVLKVNIFTHSKAHKRSTSQGKSKLNERSVLFTHSETSGWLENMATIDYKEWLEKIERTIRWGETIPPNPNSVLVVLHPGENVLNKITETVDGIGTASGDNVENLSMAKFKVDKNISPVLLMNSFNLCAEKKRGAEFVPFDYDAHAQYETEDTELFYFYRNRSTTVSQDSIASNNRPKTNKASTQLNGKLRAKKKKKNEDRDINRL